MVSIKAVTSTLAKVVPSDLARTNKRVLTAVKTGWQNGRNSTTSKNLMIRFGAKTKGVAREVKNLKFTKDEIPALAGTIATFAPVPIPGLGVAVYGVGHAIRGFIKLLK